MKTTSNLETSLDKLFTKIFPAQLPKWFSRIIADWTWLVIPAVIIVQPWVGWGYWDDVHATTVGPNFFFYIAFAVMALEVSLQVMALPGLKEHRKSSWQLLYYSVFCNLTYGVVRIFSSEGSIGPLFGMALLSAMFFYMLFQIKPWFKK
ncbi:MAG TPA: hypothetical protein VLG92_04660 [Candidatus Saccharimonadia bacterium]|nr:hypothetical protein [Candidatus Saccharimonadia bacterium]